jgi:hypothetical protein
MSMLSIIAASRRRGTIADRYRAAVMADSPVAYWRLGEASGTTAVDEMAGYNGTHVNSPTLNQSGIFDGNGSVLYGSEKRTTFPVAGLPSGNAARTLEAWIKPTSASTQVIAGYGDSATTRRGFGLFISTRFYFWTYLPDYDTGVAPTLNVWSHVCISWDGSVGRFYVNGVERYNTGSITALNTVLTRGAIAADVLTAAPGNSFLREVDEVAIYPTALSAARIAAHYAAAGY